jgi:hypothetical protein
MSVPQAVYRNAKGDLHREDGPAVELDNVYKAWYQNGLRHRLDGPAVELHNGYNAWYVNDEEITDKVNQWLAEQKITLPMSESELSFFIMTFVGK